MSIVSVDNIQPIGSGTSVTVNSAATLVLNNANSTGVITATSFTGSGANLTNLPAQATIANNADNRVITGGSGVNLNGESNLTFDGSALGLTGDLSVVGGWPRINLQATQSGGENYQIAGAVQGVNNAGFCIRNTTDSTNILEVDTDSSRNLKVVSGNLVMGTSGKGIDFSAASGSASGSSSALLDDYEEGSFTPNFVQGYNSITYNANSGFYTKIGNHVSYSIYISVLSASGQNAEIRIGLPFTTKNTLRLEEGAYIVYDANTLSTSNDEKSNCYIMSGRNYTYLRLFKNTNAAAIYGNDTTLGTGGNNTYLLIKGFLTTA